MFYYEALKTYMSSLHMYHEPAKNRANRRFFDISNVFINTECFHLI
jgi:hypothetical protein